MLPGDDLLCDLLGQVPQERIPTLLTAIDPKMLDAAVIRAREAGLAAMLYYRLKTAEGLDCIPQETRDELKATYMQTAHRNTLMLHSASLVLKACNQAGIKVIPLKGIQLAENYYGNVALRTMGDADLLVREEDLQAMRNVVEGMGYAAREYWVEAEQAETHALPPYNKERAVSLDIHWTFENPGNPFGVDVDGLWQRAHPARIAGVAAWTLCHEDFLLHLCLHATYHHRMEDALRSIFDVAWVVDHFGGQVDWPAFEKRSNEWNADRCVFLAFHFAQRLFGADVPADYLARLQPADFNREVENWGLEQLFPPLRMDPTGRTRSGGYISVNVARVLEGETTGEKVRKLFGYVFPSGSYMATRYPVAPGSLRFLLYYPRRWEDLIRDHGPAVWKLITGDRGTREQNSAHENSWRLVRWMGGGS